METLHDEAFFSGLRIVVLAFLVSDYIQPLVPLDYFGFNVYGLYIMAGVGLVKESTVLV